MANPHLQLSLLGKGILLRAGPVAGGWVKCGACTMMARACDPSTSGEGDEGKSGGQGPSWLPSAYPACTM